jgi:hypothetical protein
MGYLKISVGEDNYVAFSSPHDFWKDGADEVDNSGRFAAIQVKVYNPTKPDLIINKDGALSILASYKEEVQRHLENLQERMSALDSLNDGDPTSSSFVETRFQVARDIVAYGESIKEVDAYIRLITLNHYNLVWTDQAASGTDSSDEEGIEAPYQGPIVDASTSSDEEYPLEREQNQAYTRLSDSELPGSNT